MGAQTLLIPARACGPRFRPDALGNRPAQRRKKCKDQQSVGIRYDKQARSEESQNQSGKTPEREWNIQMGGLLARRASSKRPWNGSMRVSD
jgi:hypothetical protein